MAESRRYALNAQLDIPQILLEAQHRWLRPAEICEILQNYQTFNISSEPPARPPSGSLFLFDRKVLRYFRKDGHNWRKKKDGKTVKEAHERLKSGSVDVLHCYYAHGEGHENFQRRSYWMLEEELSHIVLVHYREVKGNRTNFNRSRDANGSPESQIVREELSNSEVGSSGGSRFHYDYHGASQVTDTASFNSSLASEYEDVESAYRHHASPGLSSIHELQSSSLQRADVNSAPYYTVCASSNYQGQFPSTSGMSFEPSTHVGNSKNPMINGSTYQPRQDHVLPSWNNSVERNVDYPSVNFQPVSLAQSNEINMIPGKETKLLVLEEVFSGGFGKRPEIGGMEEWQAPDCGVLPISNWSMHQSSNHDLNLGHGSFYPTTEPEDAIQDELCRSDGLQTSYPTEQVQQSHRSNLQTSPLNAVGISLNSPSSEDTNIADEVTHPVVKQPILNGVREGLKKLDSFDRWISKELGDVTETTMQPSSESYWDNIGNADENESTQVPPDNFILSPSLSQDQLFSIIDFSPNWAYSGLEIKVLITGRFLRNQEEIKRHKWACMFGELEVPAEIVSDGVLRCHAPSHGIGRVPFYVTCSNRLACSEVREFEFRNRWPEGSTSSDETLLHMRFGKLLSLESSTSQPSVQSYSVEISQLCSKISALLKDDSEWEQMLNHDKEDSFSPDTVRDQFLQKLLKEKLHIWLLNKIAEGGKGPSVLDEGGQGVLHFAAALGYDWAIPPTIAAGVSVDFRDVNGWTAIHWAAYNGREHTVAFLISLRASPGLLTDPTPKFPLGRTPADLASDNGHKGIAAYLAESSLTKDSESYSSRGKPAGLAPQWVPPTVGNGDLHHGLAMKDPLTAVRKATLAATHIHQVFRVQSFQRKQLDEYCDNGFGISDERALALLALKNKKLGEHGGPAHTAAIQIQNKFRSWKSRKDFLLIRQQIIKIQAHVRGHQVRKNYKKIIWSVGILDKVILRWRRKGRGLSGFKPETRAANTTMLSLESKEDDFDFLKKGRKQTEERLQKALARVKSMVQYPEARDQYGRVLNLVSEMEAKKAAYDRILNNPEANFDDDLIDFDALLEDGFMETRLETYHTPI